MLTTIKNKIVALLFGNLAARSSKALGTFAKTKDKLVALNTELSKVNAEKIKAIMKLEDSVEANQNVAKSNSKIIAKLESFLA